MSKATLEKLPQSEGADFFIVLDPKEGIVHHAYTADLGRSFGHDHIKDAQLDGVTSAARWVVRPLFAATPAAAAPVVLPEEIPASNTLWMFLTKGMTQSAIAGMPERDRKVLTERAQENWAAIRAEVGATAPVVQPEPDAAITEVMKLVERASVQRASTAVLIYTEQPKELADKAAVQERETVKLIETKLRALLTAVSTPAAHADALGTFPTMTDELASILGLMCFQCISFAQALRAGGYSIKKRAEDEQAAVLHWMLGHYFHSGADGWRAAARADMERMCKASTKEGGAA